MEGGIGGEIVTYIPRTLNMLRFRGSSLVYPIFWRAAFAWPSDVVGALLSSVMEALRFILLINLLLFLSSILSSSSAPRSFYLNIEQKSKMCRMCVTLVAGEVMDSAQANRATRRSSPRSVDRSQTTWG
jgi:hypothetical protein